MQLKTLILYELVKALLAVIIVIALINVTQSYYENVANQFILNDSNENGNRCALYPSTLKGVSDVDTEDIPTMKQLEQTIFNLNLKDGGIYKPKTCIEREKLAIIIPYRDRYENLVLLLKYLHPMLQRQNRYYRVFLVEQYSNDIFNKGRIMNIAALEALKLDKFNCFIFHDVDLIPENDFNIYECDTQPRHLSPAVDELRYTLMYYNLVGGVLALNRQQLESTNGFSNLYWGWGAG